MDLVSIIMSVFNAEDDLRLALECACGQTYKNIEIICVDDGSTDNSPKILDEYARNNSRIKVIHHKKNQGVSIARNTGLDAARGTYIMFLDADDHYMQETVKNAYKCITKNNGDIVMFSECIFPDEDIFFPSATIEFCKENFNKEVSINDLDYNFINTVWNKIYRHKFLSDNNIRFNENLSIGEDSLFCISCILNNPKVYTLPEFLYSYRKIKKSSLSNNDNAGIILLDSIKYYVETNKFKITPEQCKINILDRYFKCCLFDYNNATDRIFKMYLKIKIYGKIRYLKKVVGVKLLKKCPHYKEFYKNYSNNFLIIKKNFSLENNLKKTKKNIKICG